MRVKVIGASSPFPAERLAAGVKVLLAQGFDVDDADALQGTHAYLNGDDATRIALLDRALAAAGVDVVWLARGGYGLTRIASRLTIPQRIPLVVGFSDATALFARLHREGLAHRAIHGPLATSIAHEGKDTVDHLVDVVSGGAGHTLPALQVLTPTTATRIEAPLFAGNLCVLAALCGTPLQPDLRGHLVALEEVGERPYRLDRMLTQLIDAGCFTGVVGFIVGHLTGCEEPANPATSATSSPRDAPPTAVAVVVERLATLGVPVFAGLPFGHESPNWALPLARKVVLDVKADGAALLLSRASVV